MAAVRPKLMIERLFRLSESKTNARTEALAGVTTFLEWLGSCKPTDFV